MTADGAVQKAHKAFEAINNGECIVAQLHMHAKWGLGLWLRRPLPPHVCRVVLTVFDCDSLVAGASSGWHPSEQNATPNECGQVIHMVYNLLLHSHDLQPLTGGRRVHMAKTGSPALPTAAPSP